MPTKNNLRKSNIILGKNIERLRIIKNITSMELGRQINQTKQQVVKYERGEVLVPLPILERIGATFEESVPKKIIRKICFTRKLEFEKKIELTEELIDLYNQALPGGRLQ